MIRVLAFLLLTCSAPLLGSDHRFSEIDTWLNKFHVNPKKQMQTLPPKWSNTTQHERDYFSPIEIESKKFIEMKNDFRQEIIGYSHESVIFKSRAPQEAPMAENDQPSELVGEDLEYTKLTEIEQHGLKQAKLHLSPWSDDYWGIFKGGLGARYADPKFPEDNDWRINFDYIKDNPLSAILDSQDPNLIDNLSPAEKYDLIVGDKERNMTNQMWEQGQHYYERDGEVETWFGICHGWAAAAYMLPRPKHVIEIPAANLPIKIKLYPSDIKAYASALWAGTRTPTRFIGGRCNIKEPETNENGRVIRNNCFDNNPGSWHLAIVNRVGKAQKSFVMDASFDWEVWNQPVVGYDYIYFNPETRMSSDHLDQATIPIEEFSNDKFTEFRSTDATHIVGIAMDVAYVVETLPTHRSVDHPDFDHVKQVRYIYDLELNNAREIVGGEWYMNLHPDFLWTPYDDAQARTRFDQMLEGEWEPGERIPQNWKEPAKVAASRGVPLARIVNYLIERSRSQEN